MICLLVYPSIVGTLEPSRPFEIRVFNGLVFKQSIDDLAIGVNDWAGEAVSVFHCHAYTLLGLVGLGLSEDDVPSLYSLDGEFRVFK